MKVINVIALILVIVGAINWGLWALFQFDIVAAIFGPASVAGHVVYIIIGLAGIYALSFFRHCCRRCHPNNNDDHKSCCSK